VLGCSAGRAANSIKYRGLGYNVPRISLQHFLKGDSAFRNLFADDQWIEGVCAWSTVHFLYHFGRFRLNHQLSSIILPHERANGNPNFLDFMNIIGFWLKKTVPAGLSRAHFLYASNQVTDESRPMATRGYWGQHPPSVFVPHQILLRP